MKAWMVYFWPAYISARKRTTVNKLGSEPFYQEGSAIMFAHKVNDAGGHAEEPEPFELSCRFALWLHMMRHTDWDEYEPPSHDDPDSCGDNECPMHEN